MSISDKVCYGCHTLINDPSYLMTADHHWHLSCLKCFDCGISFEEEDRCFTRFGRIFCKDDYIKRYCSRICTRCNRIIEQDEDVLRAEDNIYHLNCFTCLSCNTLLHPGDEFGFKENLIFCRNHLFEEQLFNSHKILDDSGYNTSPNARQKEEYFVSISSDETILFSYQNRSDRLQQKRLRTSFKHHQIRYMRSYFSLNHNPDAKELKNLSEKTNLSKRVLQVWFQNARAKYRRSNTSSFTYQHQSSGINNENSTNLSSPTESVRSIS